ncbi:MAG: TubC N-terminal docking domain-related protein [Thermoguttaceae bacterium]
MTLDHLLAALNPRGVTLWAEGDKIRGCGPVSPEILAAIRIHNAELLERLRRGQDCDPLYRLDYWLNTPTRDGRVRTTCACCLRFIGYRPSEN